MTPRATNYPDGTLWNASKVDEVRNDYARRLQVPATYTLFKEGTTYYADHCDGTSIDFSGTNAATVINNVFSTGLTSGRAYQEKVYVKGDITTSDPIQIPDYTIFQFDGRIMLANNSDCNIIENADTISGNEWITIDGGGLGILDQNYLNQASGNCINFTNPTGLSETIIIKNLEALNFRNHGVYAERTVKLMMHHCRVANGLDEAVYFDNVGDSYIHHILPFDGGSGTERSFHLVNDCNSFHISDCYINNGMWLEGINVLVSNMLFDSNLGVRDIDALTLDGVRYSTFSNLTFRIQGSAAIVDKNCITVTDTTRDSYQNDFSNIYGGRRGGAGTNLWNYVIEETDANQDYNTYSNINGIDCNTGALRRQGVNSRYDVNTMIGTVVGLSENSGTSTGTGAQQTIAHGLIGTPNRVFLSDIELGADAYQSAVADGVNIYIWGIINQDYAWEAKIV